MTGLWSKMVDLEARIEKVAREALRIAQPAPAVARETMTVIQQEVAINAYDLTPQQATFRNGDRDTIVIQRMTCAVNKCDTPSSDPLIRLPLEKVPQGWHRRNNNYSAIDSEFDFLWNYSVLSRQASYSRDMLMSDSLVGLDRGKMLDFRVPLVIPRGESITFTVAPMMFLIPSSATPPTVGSSIYYVSFIGLGYRRGEER